MRDRIYGRNCYVEKIELRRAVEFISEHHRQGAPKRIVNPYPYGIFDKVRKELLGVLLVANPRTSHMRERYHHEISRLAFCKDVRIIGGASKLISHFIREKNPYNLFTYQSLAGEVTDVYERAGMTFVSESPAKRVLLHNSVPEFKQARNNRKDWFSMEQVVRFGPDNLLKTNLGEVIRDGHRLTNVELFTEILGYRIVDVPGDRVYDWHNPEVSYYVYKISATDSEKYYIGRSSIWGANVTVEDCLNDGYFGSGGQEFQSWKKAHRESLQKEIIGLYKKFEQAVRKEKKEISLSYKADPRCLNRHTGNVPGARSSVVTSISYCPKHGETSHSSHQKCVKCCSEKQIIIDMCSVHGESKHRGGVCFKCSSSRWWSVKNCPEHGETKHHKSSCSQCAADKRVEKYPLPNPISLGTCDKHGEVKFTAGQCSICLAEQTFGKGTCPIHDSVTTRSKSGVCVSCANSSYIFDKDCPTHGTTPHVNDKCFQCLRSSKKALGLVDLNYNDSDKTCRCPDCGFVFKVGKTAGLLYKTLRGYNPCPSCRWWKENLVTRAFLVRPMFHEDINTRENKKKALDLRCPLCGFEFQLSFQSFNTRVCRDATLCHNCRVKKEDLSIC